MGMKDSEGGRCAINEVETKNDQECQNIMTRIIHSIAFHVSDKVSPLEDLAVLGATPERNSSNTVPLPRLFDTFGFILERDERDEYDYDTGAVSRDCGDIIKSTDKELSAEEWKLLLDRCALTDSGASPSASVNTVKHFMRIGLPCSLRRRAWTTITGVNATVRKREGVYQALVQKATCLMENESEEAILLRVIERDLHRTFPHHSFFCDPAEEQTSNGIAVDRDSAEELMPDGLISLRHVLYAYTFYDNEVGYCQGMNFIVAMFLTFLSEEESFWMLVAVMNEEPYGMRGLFDRDMAGFHETLYVAEKAIQQFLPELHRHLEREHVDVSMFVTQWILTIFARAFPLDLVLRFWDSYVTEGWKAVYRMILSLLARAQDDLLGLDLERILCYLKDEFPSRVDGPSVIAASLKIPLGQEHVRRYTAEWRLARKNGNGHLRRKSSVYSETLPSVDSNTAHSRSPVEKDIALPRIIENGKHIAKTLLPGLFKPLGIDPFRN